MLKRVGESKHPCLTLTHCGSEPVSYAAIKVNCTRGLVVEAFNDLDQDGINFIKPHKKQKGFMSHSVKRLFLKQQRRERGLVDVGDTSHTVS